MDRLVYRISDWLRLVLAALVVGAVVAGCSTAASGTALNAAVVTESMRYVDPQGWSLRYASPLSLERSTSGPGLATFTEANFPPGARFPDGLQFAFAKVAWGGNIVFLPGLGGNPPRTTSYALLWPATR